MPFAANGIAPPEYPVRLKTRGEVTKEQLQQIEPQSSSATTPDFIIMSNHIHAILFLHEKAGGASPSPTTEPGASTVDEVCHAKEAAGG